MNTTTDPTPAPLGLPTRLGSEISVTGKWVPTTPDGWFFRSATSRELRAEWQAIHDEARAAPGVLSTEINQAVGQDAVLVHHVFASPDAMATYLGTVAAKHRQALAEVATPELHLVRGVEIPGHVRAAVSAADVEVAFGEHRFGWVRDEYRRPDPSQAIQVTAKWTALPGHERHELEHWWRVVAEQAWTLEKGLVRFEAYAVPGEEALIIHETFDTTSELRFHLTRGTASKYKSELDTVSTPECYYFRGPVSWDIRTYSKFMHLPATYSSQIKRFEVPAGNMSDGLV